MASKTSPNRTGGQKHDQGKKGPSERARKAIARRLKTLRDTAGGWNRVVELLGGKLSRPTLARYAAPGQTSWGGFPPFRRVLQLAIADARRVHGIDVTPSLALETAKQWLADAEYESGTDSELEEELAHWIRALSVAQDSAQFEEFKTLPLDRKINAVMFDLATQDDFSAFANARASTTDEDRKVIAACLLTQPDIDPHLGAHLVIVMPFAHETGNAQLEIRDFLNELRRRVGDRHNLDKWKGFLNANPSENEVSVVAPIFTSEHSFRAFDGVEKDLNEKVLAKLATSDGKSPELFVLGPLEESKEGSVPWCTLYHKNESGIDERSAWMMYENEPIREKLGPHPSAYRFTTLCRRMDRKEIGKVLLFLEDTCRFKRKATGGLRPPDREGVTEK